MHTFSPIFAYFGPETILPVTSVIATVVGVAMMLGRNSTRLLVRGTRRLYLQTRHMVTSSRPHVRLHKGRLASDTVVSSTSDEAQTRAAIYDTSL